MNTERAKDKARKYEHRRQYDKAIEVYSRIIRSLEGKAELVDDLALFNKLGDLYLKVGDVGSAVESYERAADHYSDQGLANNAIALCNKILRSAPGRTSVYLKLAKLLMQRGFAAEVKRNLVEYWDRMARAGEPEAAFEALEDFVDAYSTRREVLVIVSELFMKGGRTEEARALLAKLYEDVVRDGSEQERRAILEEIQAIDPTFAAEAEADEAETEDSEIVFISPDDPDDLDIALASVELEPSQTGVSGFDIETSKTAEVPGIVLPDDHEPSERDDPSLVVVSDVGEADHAHAVIETPDEMAAAVTADEVESAGVEAPPDTGEGRAAPPAAVPPHIARLESRVAESPDVLEIHRELAEALLEYGDRERGLQELDIVLLGCEEAEDWHKAQAVVEEILRVDPNSVNHHRKRVTYVERNGLVLEPGSFERGRWVSELVRANLDLGDALVREGTINEAQVVYRRVLKYETGNRRAETALEALGLAESDAPNAPPRAGAPVPHATDASAVPEGGASNGDGDRRLRSVLDNLETGVHSGMSAEDSQAHYDLGVAFKEMGLLDEAISEFQKALGGKNETGRAAEALGLCFFEKGQVSVAATILKRASEADPPGDASKLGLLYWLGRCHEEQGDADSARDLYQRVTEVDAGYEDIDERVRNLPAAGT